MSRSRETGKAGGPQQLDAMWAPEGQPGTGKAIRGKTSKSCSPAGSPELGLGSQCWRMSYGHVRCSDRGGRVKSIRFTSFSTFLWDQNNLKKKKTSTYLPMLQNLHFTLRTPRFCLIQESLHNPHLPVVFIMLIQMSLSDKEFFSLLLLFHRKLLTEINSNMSLV